MNTLALGPQWLDPDYLIADIRPDRRPGHRLRGVRPADRLLPAGRLAAVHHRSAGDDGKLDGRCGWCAADRAWPRSSVTRWDISSAARSGPSLFKRPDSKPLQAGERREGARVLREARPEVAGAGPLRADRADVHADHRGREPDELPLLHHLQLDRRRLWGAGVTLPGRRAREDRVRPQAHRADAGRDRAAVGRADRDRVPARPRRGEEGASAPRPRGPRPGPAPDTRRGARQCWPPRREATRPLISDRSAKRRPSPGAPFLIRPVSL